MGRYSTQLRWGAWGACALALLLAGGVWRIRAWQGTHHVHADVVAYQAPQFLTFAELHMLLDDPTVIEGSLREKYDALWTTPIISNEAYYRNVQPHRPVRPGLGPIVRLATWNIEHAQHMSEAIAAFTDTETFSFLIDVEKAPVESPTYRAALAERALLTDADIVVLQEMDIGVKRSGYRNTARDLAQAMQMNYAFLPEYLEIDPAVLGTEKIIFEDGADDIEAMEYYLADPKRYKGLFGCAVLSRYPIVHVEGRRLKAQGYDWYTEEKKKTSFLEKLRRLGAKTVLMEEHHREIKVGGRTYFRVDILVPEIPQQRVSIINVHLEIKCQPKDRARQLAEILEYIKDIRHPVILAGDFNSASQDLSPTSTARVIGRTITSPQFLFGRLVEVVTPQALAINVVRFVSTLTKNYQNPTAAHIPFVAPNYTRQLFQLIAKYRFADGKVFDFRGDAARSAGTVGMLSNANERDLWAYTTTFRLKRTVVGIIGKFRLDWIFVKSYLTHRENRREPYRFAPHFGRTLNALNEVLRERISDHDPIVVDLPLFEPTITN